MSHADVNEPLIHVCENAIPAEFILSTFLIEKKTKTLQNENSTLPLELVMRKVYNAK